MSKRCLYCCLLFLLTGLLCGGCGDEKTYSYVAPDGTRYEYTPAELEVMDNGETHYRRPPKAINVWRTRPGPETGPESHELINPYFTGYESTDIPALEREMRMQPGLNQWPHNQPAPYLKSEVAMHWQQQHINHRSVKCSRKPSVKSRKSNSKNSHCQTTATHKSGNTGLRKTGPSWMQDDYGADSGMYDWIKANLKKK